jgi:hypothetical protein
VSSETALTGKELVVLSADGQQRFVTPVLEGWRWDLRTIWLDNEHLVFNLAEDPSHDTDILATTVVNPFTGTYVELASDYPDLKPNPLGPAGTLHFSYSTVVYEPFLEMVVYPQTTTDGDYVALWDRQSQRTVARIETPGGFLRVPVWSPDAMQFVIAVIAKRGMQPGEFVEELYSLDRGGSVIQLTRFADYFSQAEIGNLNWSPDGRHLAFWIRTTPSVCAGENLATLDMTTEQVTNYCVLGSNDKGIPASAPVWSLDSQYVAAYSYKSEAASSRVLLVNIDQGWVAQVAESAYPVGWLVGP